MTHPLRTIVAAAAIAVTSLMVAPAAEPPAAKARRCLEGGTTLAGNRDVRLYRVGSAEEHVLYACVRGDRRRKLGVWDGTQPAGPRFPRLAGRFVAFDDITCARDGGCTAALQVIDMLTGRTRRVALIDDDAGAVRDLVLKPNGAMAWTRTVDLSGRVVLRRSDDAGEDVVLDAEPGIVPGSLALAGGTLYWTRAGQARTAPLR